MPVREDAIELREERITIPEQAIGRRGVAIRVGKTRCNFGREKKSPALARLLAPALKKTVTYCVNPMTE